MALCKEFKPLGFRWSCTRVSHSDYETLKAMADAGCRLLIVGFESGDPQILKNIKKGATIEMGRNFVKNCKKVGSRPRRLHHRPAGRNQGDHPEDHRFRQGARLRNNPGLLAHAYPGTELYDQGTREGFLAGEAITDAGGHQLPHLQYPGLVAGIHGGAVNRFYDSYYFRPQSGMAHRSRALWDAHERKRLYQEAVDFLKLRHDRRKVAKKGVQKKAMVQVPPSVGVARESPGA